MNHYNFENKTKLSVKERVEIDSKKYVAALQRHANKSKKEKSKILFENEWPSFSDYSFNELKRYAYNIIDSLEILDVGFKGVYFTTETTTNIVEPVLNVELNKEYRGEQTLIQEMFPLEISTKGGYKKIRINYVIFS